MKKNIVFFSFLLAFSAVSMASAVDVAAAGSSLSEVIVSVVAVGVPVLLIYWAVQSFRVIKREFFGQSSTDQGSEFFDAYASGDAVAGVDFVDVDYESPLAPLLHSDPETEALNAEIRRKYLEEVYGDDPKFFE